MAMPSISKLSLSKIPSQKTTHPQILTVHPTMSAVAVSSFRDRTAEFQSLSETLKKIGGISTVNNPSPSPSDQLPSSSEFKLTASRIGLGIHEAKRKIARLSQFAKRSSMFDDPTVEIQELTALIKNDLTALNAAVADLQTLQNQEIVKKCSDDTAFHVNAICNDVKNRLMAATKQFQEVLTARTQNIKAHESRKQIFSASSSRENPFKQQPKLMAAEPPPWLNTSKAPASMQSTSTPSNGVQTAGQLRRRLATDSVSSNMEMQMLQEVVSQQENYSQSRSTALHNVESTISEISGMFTDLARVVAQQGELAIRIDDNMGESVNNVHRAHDSLLKHLTRISSNRSLLIKLFAILIFFLFVFIFVV